MMNIVAYADWIRVAAALVVLVVATRRAERAGLDGLVAYAAGVAGLVGAFVGGHLLVVLADPASLVVRPGRLWDVGATPKAAFGAFAGAAAFGAAVLWAWGKPVVRYADATVPAVVLGYVIYRVGCVVAGCEVGIATDAFVGVTYPAGTGVFAHHVSHGLVEATAAHTGAVHPISAYHVGLGLALLAVLHAEPFGVGRGQQVLAALGGYGVVRFALEFLRDEPALAAGWTLGQWGSLAAVGIVLVGAAVLVRRPPNATTNPGPSPTHVSAS